MSATNFYALRPIYYAIDKAYYLHACMLFCAMMSSIMYHLFEHSKHNMPGINQNYNKTNIEYIFLQFDRFFALSNIFLFLFTFDIFDIDLTVIYVALICLFLSETLPKNLKQEKLIYFVTHALWHFFAFHIAYKILIIDDNFIF